MWCHLPTGFKRYLTLLTTVLSLLFIAVFTTLIFSHVSEAAEGTNKTLSFQGRLLRANGAVVPDGNYNIQFKLYQDGTGTLPNNSDGGANTLKWTENYINNNGTGGVQVKNGLFSVELGSKTPFASLVDWNQDTLWLSMNVAGSAIDCTDFGTGTCTADGEMLPMKRLTSTPYAMNAGALNGKTAANFIQLAQGVQEDASNNTSSIYINKTGLDGNLIQLQSSGKDAFRVDSTGDIEFGSATDHDIRVAQSGEDIAGRDLTVVAGHGGNGNGNNGGSLILQGGAAGGTNGNGGDIDLDAGAGTGTGIGGNVTIGTTQAANIVIGTTYQSNTQNILIGANETAGSTTNTVIGNGGGAASGTTKVQAKDSAAIATDGVDRATFDNNGSLTLGNGISSNAPSDFRIQGTASSADGVGGGNLTIQGGGATTGNANGGNVEISGGAGSGDGAKGLVVIDTPTYKAAGIQSSAVTTDVTQLNIDSFGVVTLNATADNVAFTLGAPSLGANAAGRIVYVTAANGSHDFILRANVGGGNSIEQNMLLRQNSTFTMIWNGTLWTAAGGGGSSGTLQDAYNSSVQSSDAGGMIVNTAGSNGLTIRNNNDTSGNSILSVESAAASPLLSVTSTSGQLATNPGAETAGSSSSTFPANTWSNSGIDAGGPGLWDTTVTRNTDPAYTLSGEASVKVQSQNSWTGVRNHINATLTPGATYSVTASIRTHADTLSNMEIDYMPKGDPSEDWVGCQQSITATATWSTITCTFQIPTTGISAPTNSNALYINSGESAGTYYIDNVSITRVNSAGNVKIGSDSEGADPTLLTLNKSATPPPIDNSDALLGSMYYDTSIGKVQCYEADGWGSCGAAPDTFITLSPEYANGVIRDGVTDASSQTVISTDFCSDTLNINDGSSSQPSICGTNETYNYYRLKNGSAPSTTKEIYVTYRLPAGFKKFAADTTSLMAKTNVAGASTSYQLYRGSAAGTTACGSSITASSGAQSAWQKASASGANDPTGCEFAAGDNIIFKITLTSGGSTGEAYVSDINFAYSNN